MFFTRLNFTVPYCPGTKNIKADALSRQTDQTNYPKIEENIISETLLVAPVQWDIMTEIVQINRQNDPPPNCPPELPYAPESLRDKLLHQVHNSPSSVHPGINAIQLLKNRFWWPAMSTDKITFVNACAACNISKSPWQLPAGLLQPLTIPQHPWSHITIDFVTDLPISQSNTTVLTDWSINLIDRFSKACHLIPLT